MFKRILSALLIAALVVFVSSAVTNAVTGKFTTIISFRPQQTPTHEFEKLDFDFENLLDLAFTISGLTFTLKTAMGIAGLEYVILDQEVNLGALTIKDEFVFAAPFDATARRLADLHFVKKRVTAEISIGGITLKNLALFEDVRWDHPYTLPTPPVQKFVFGNILTISGETPSGIKITFITGISASSQDKNKIKKFTFDGAVVPQSTSLEVEEKLRFVEEKIEIRGVKIGPLTFDIDLTNEPFVSPPHIWRAKITAKAVVPPFGFSTTWTTDDLLSFTGSMTISITIAGIAEFDIFPTPPSISADIKLPLDPVPATLRLRISATAEGLTSLRPTLTMLLGAGASVEIDALWSGTPPAPVTLQWVKTKLEAIPAGNFRVTAEATFNVGVAPAGLKEGKITLEIPF